MWGGANPGHFIGLNKMVYYHIIGLNKMINEKNVASNKIIVTWKQKYNTMNDFCISNYHKSYTFAASNTN